MDQPWLKFYTRDYLDHKELHRCSILARALWPCLLCLMGEGTPRGYLTDKLGPLAPDYIARRTVFTAGQVKKAMTELLDNKIAAVTESGVVYSPKMIQDEEVRLKRARGGSASQNNPHVPRRKDILNGPTDCRSLEEPPIASSSVDSSPREVSRGRSAEGGVPPMPFPNPVPDAVVLQEIDVRFGTWDMDESYQPLVELYRRSGKPLIDEDFADAWWGWKVLDFEQQLERIERLRSNLDNGVYSAPTFIPAPKKFIDREWKRNLKPATTGTVWDQKKQIRDATFEQLVSENLKDKGLL